MIRISDFKWLFNLAMEELLLAMNASVRSPTSNDFYLSPEHLR